MSNVVNLLSKLNIKEKSGIIFQNTDTYPENPEIGQLAFVNKLLSIYSEDLDGSPSWHPLVNANVITYTHTQGLESLSWVINHNLNTSDLIYFVYDETDSVVYPSTVEFISNNVINLTFTESIKGKCIIFSANLVSSTLMNYAVETKQSSFIAQSNKIYSIDTLSNVVSVNMPGSPNNGDWVGFIDKSANFSVNNVNILYDGTNKLQYTDDNFILDVDELNIKFVFANNNWVILD